MQGVEPSSSPNAVSIAQLARCLPILQNVKWAAETDTSSSSGGSNGPDIAWPWQTGPEKGGLIQQAAAAAAGSRLLVPLLLVMVEVMMLEPTPHVLDSGLMTVMTQLARGCRPVWPL